MVTHGHCLGADWLVLQTCNHMLAGRKFKLCQDRQCVLEHFIHIAKYWFVLGNRPSREIPNFCHTQPKINDYKKKNV